MAEKVRKVHCKIRIEQEIPGKLSDGRDHKPVK